MSRSNQAGSVEGSARKSPAAPSDPKLFDTRVRFARALPLPAVRQCSLANQTLVGAGDEESLCAPTRCCEVSMTISTDSIGSAPVDSARGQSPGSGDPCGELQYSPTTVSSTSTKSRWSSHSRGVENRAVYGVRHERVEIGFGGAGWGSFHCVRSDSNRPVYFSRLLKFLRDKGKSREDAEDLIQEAMLRLHVYAKDDAIVNPEAFLRRTLFNLAIDRYRRDRFGSRLEVQIEDVDRQSPLIAPDPTPEQIVEYQQRLKYLTSLLEAASPRTREIYIAHRSGYSYAEIAVQMGIAQVTVKRHIARALLVIMEHGLTN
jgi:RNA polymerase sigma factor (sigma-70 family)